MVLLGASDSQIRTVSYGEERPAAEGDDESAWRLNRRVEIIYRVR
jgi:peptidoglycan-associated lipoprotein